MRFGNGKGSPEWAALIAVKIVLMTLTSPRTSQMREFLRASRFMAKTLSPHVGISLPVAWKGTTRYQVDSMKPEAPASRGLTPSGTKLGELSRRRRMRRS